MGNSLIIYEFVEWVRKFFLEHKSLFTRLVPQTYSENYDFFRVLCETRAFYPNSCIRTEITISPHKRSLFKQEITFFFYLLKSKINFEAYVRISLGCYDVNEWFSALTINRVELRMLWVVVIYFPHVKLGMWKIYDLLHPLVE